MIQTQQTTRAAQHWRAGQKAAMDKQWTGAAREFERAVQLAPKDASAWHALALSQANLARLPEATLSAQRAFELAPADVKICLLVVRCLMLQNRHSEAADTFGRLAPEAVRDAEFLVAHATELFVAHRSAEAIPVLLKALTYNLVNPAAHFRMGLAFKDLGREQDANLCFETALATDKAGTCRAMVLSQLVFSTRAVCDWQHIAARTAALLLEIDSGGSADEQQPWPFDLLALDATPEQQLRAGRRYSNWASRDIKPLPKPGRRRPGRVRVGYLSSDLTHHATAMLITGLLEARDCERFEVFLYSHGREDDSDTGRRIRATGDHFIDVSHWCDLDVAKRMREDGIDIAIDLKSHTRDSRFQLLAHRPAPVQVAFLGYPGSSGADFLDYVIGDPIVTPLNHAAQYSEKIAQMPRSYQPNDRQRALPPRPTRKAVGLPDDAVVLCCFNQLYKISPHQLDLWARILDGAPNTVLWMLIWAQQGHVNLSRELAARGVDLARVFFAPKLDLGPHIARLRCADLFLDTWPCNAHTTASEALWAGVPVLTVPGPTFASRVAASLVTACGQPEMACVDEETYVQTAIRLAQSPPELRAKQVHLDTNRMTLPLFDTERFARDYDALLMRMFERQQAGSAPEHLAGMPAEAMPEIATLEPNATQSA